MEIEYEKDYDPIKIACVATTACSAITFLGISIGKSTESLLEVVTRTQSSAPILDDFTFTTYLVGIAAIFIGSYVMANYITAGWENGIFGLPYKLDCHYKKIPIRR